MLSLFQRLKGRPQHEDTTGPSGGSITGAVTLQTRDDGQATQQDDRVRWRIDGVLMDMPLSDGIRRNATNILLEIAERERRQGYEDGRRKGYEELHAKDDDAYEEGKRVGYLQGFEEGESEYNYELRQMLQNLRAELYEWRSRDRQRVEQTQLAIETAHAEAYEEGYAQRSLEVERERGQSSHEPHHHPMIGELKQDIANLRAELHEVKKRIER